MSPNTDFIFFGLNFVNVDNKREIAHIDGQ